MRNYRKYLLLVGSLCALAASASGCQAREAADNKVQETGSIESERLKNSGEETGKLTTILCDQTAVSINGNGASESDGIITITEGGTYRLEGILTEGRIVVDAAKEDTIILELNGFEITSSNLSAIYGKKSGEIRLRLMDGTVNKVTDGGEYALEEGEDEPDAAIFTKKDLIIEGKGALEVTGNYNDGIRSKDNLNILSGEITVTAKEDGIKGKDSLVVDGGTITVHAGDDGMKSKGAVIVNDGIIQVAESYEGIEAQTIDINGGSLDITSTDDGLNAVEDTSKTEETGNGKGRTAIQENAYIRISGGTIHINASADGVDSNGHFYVDGGELYISGPTSSRDGALDYDGNGIITGGVVIAAGSSGMAQTFSDGSEQNSILVYFENTQEAGTEITVVDASGNLIAAYTPVKEYSSAVISAPGLETEGTYKITAGEETQEVTITTVLTTSGSRAAGTMPGGHRGQGGMGEGRPDMNGGFEMEGIPEMEDRIEMEGRPEMNDRSEMNPENMPDNQESESSQNQEGQATEKDQRPNGRGMGRERNKE